MPTAPGPRYGAAELLGTTGNLLANVYVQGIGIGPQVNFSPGLLSIIATGLKNPSGVALDGSGNIFVADTGNNLVKEIVAAGGYSTVKTLGTPGSFSGPVGLALDGGGNIFVADYGNRAVKEILAASNYTVVNTLSIPFSFPAGVAVDGSGNLFVADSGNEQIEEIQAAGGYVTARVLATVSDFTVPYGVAVDAKGNVFVVSFGHSSLEEIYATGGYTNAVLLPGAGNFHNPAGLAVDINGNLFVPETFENTLVEVLAASGYATVQTLSTGFVGPFAVALDGSGNVFVADNGNNSVDKVDYTDPPSLSFASTTVGSQSSDSPQSVTVSDNGNADLTFPVLAGTNPGLASGFTLDAATTCPDLSASSSTAGTLAQGTSCVYAVDFMPQMGGSNSGSLVLTDNNLNLAKATQSIGLSGSASLQVSTTTSVMSSSNPSVAGQSVTFTATVTELAPGTSIPTRRCIVLCGWHSFDISDPE